MTDTGTSSENRNPRTGGDAQASMAVRRVARARQLAIALDLDGTLVPFAATPRSVTLDAVAMGILTSLASAPQTRVAIVSGRPKDDLEMLVGARNDIWLAAEHGAWTRGGADWSPLVLNGPRPEKIERALRSVSASHRGSIVERKTWSVCLHYREVAPSDREGLIVEAMHAIERWLSSRPEYELLEGVLVLEVRHRGAHKGRVIEWLRAQTERATSILALGDDVTDEDAFDALGPDDVAIAVGRADRPTRAEAHLAGSEEVRSFLRWLARARTDHADTRELVALGAQPRARAHAARSAALVVVSNRLPTADGSNDRSRNVGGLVSGVSAALATHRGIWLGWSGQQHEGEARLGIDERASPPRASFDLRPEWHSLYYNGFANRGLWPVLHGFTERARFREAEWESYVRVNEAFAEHAAQLAARDAMVWAHDYHLFLLGRALRARQHRGPIGHFLHVPFPALEAIETVPHVGELVAAMLEFDLLGFHTRRYADNFVRAASALIGVTVRDGCPQWRGRDVRVGVFPLGIDADDFRTGEDDDGAMEIADLQAALCGRALVLGVDRLDYSKGILERMDGFAQMLELYPEWRGRVSFLQVAVPSRQDVPEYAQQRRAIESAVGRINGKYGEAHWVPVRYVYRSYGRTSLARLYRAAAVGLVTPLRDGMNLVAKEYVAAQDAANPGVLVLSRFAGAAGELDAAVLTNPYDRHGMAHDLAHALAMPHDERVRRQERLDVAVRCNRPAAWAASFLRELSRTQPRAPVTR